MTRRWEESEKVTPKPIPLTEVEKLAVRHREASSRTKHNVANLPPRRRPQYPIVESKSSSSEDEDNSPPVEHDIDASDERVMSFFQGAKK